MGGILATIQELLQKRLKIDKTLIKVPQKITIAFWLIKSCATTVGESLSDTFNTTLGLGLGYTALLFFPILFVLLFAQFYTTTYIPILYWIVVVLMSICGTIVTDGFHDNLGVELWIEVVVFFVLMSASFYWWYRSQGTLDIHSINTIKREAFYWNAVMFTFALGTAVGDLISESFAIGYGYTFLLFLIVILVVAGIWYFLKLNDVLSFWLAYVMTRPLGAATGDLLSVPPANGGAGLTVGGTSGLFLGIIVIAVIYLSWSKVDQIPQEEELNKNASGSQVQVQAPVQDVQMNNTSNSNNNNASNIDQPSV